MLEILADDGRVPVARVAQKVGRTSNAVRHRLRQLRHQGVVRRFRVHVQPARLGPCVMRLVLVRTGLGEDGLTSIARHPDVSLVLPLEGTHEASVVVTCRDEAAFERFLEEQVRSRVGAEGVQVIPLRSDAELPLARGLCAPSGFPASRARKPGEEPPSEEA